MMQDAQRACHRYCQDWRQGARASGGNEKGFRQQGELLHAHCQWLLYLPNLAK